MLASPLDQPSLPALGQLVALEGGNFSGRTDILRQLTGMEGHATVGSAVADGNERPLAYIGPEVYNAISGLATTVYGCDFTSAVERENIVGTQFHPEKSRQTGFRVLRNFVEHY